MSLVGEVAPRTREGQLWCLKFVINLNDLLLKQQNMLVFLGSESKAAEDKIVK